MLHHLAPNGSMALLLANGSMSSNSSGEGDIRRALIEADLVETAPRECATLNSDGIPQVVSAARDNMVALTGQLFTNTQIPACIWFLTKNKAKRTRPGASALRDRRGETLFIDAHKLGFMKDRVLRDFAPEDIEDDGEGFDEKMTRLAADLKGQLAESAKLEVAIKANLKELGYAL